MAYVSNSELRSAPVSGGFVATLLAVLRETMQRRKIYNETVSELSQLSSRELSDLAIARCEIKRIAIESAYGQSTR
jgi:uncharacterized protein YjiS (DUF1127 family)